MLERAKIIREQTIDHIGAEGHGRAIEPPPAIIAGEHRTVADIEAKQSANLRQEKLQLQVEEARREQQRAAKQAEFVTSAQVDKTAAVITAEFWAIGCTSRAEDRLKVIAGWIKRDTIQTKSTVLRSPSGR